MELIKNTLTTLAAIAFLLMSATKSHAMENPLLSMSGSLPDGYYIETTQVYRAYRDFKLFNVCSENQLDFSPSYKRKEYTQVTTAVKGEYSLSVADESGGFCDYKIECFYFKIINSANDEVIWDFKINRLGGGINHDYLLEPGASATLLCMMKDAGKGEDAYIDCGIDGNENPGFFTDLAILGFSTDDQYSLDIAIDP